MSCAVSNEYLREVISSHKIVDISDIDLETGERGDITKEKMLEILDTSERVIQINDNNYFDIFDIDYYIVKGNKNIHKSIRILLSER